MKEIKEQFVTYEIALKLKELGFDEECLAYYSKEGVYADIDYNKTNFVLLSSKKMGELVGHGSVNNSLFKWLKENDKTSGELYTLSESVTASLWQQAIDFLREKYLLHIEIQSPDYPDDVNFSWNIHKICEFGSLASGESFDYYKVREQAILKCIELLKNK